MPLYGYYSASEKGKGAIIDKKNVDRILNDQYSYAFKWDEEEKELLAKDLSREGSLSIPNRKFYTERLKLAVDSGLAGVGLWEISQAIEAHLDHF